MAKVYIFESLISEKNGILKGNGQHSFQRERSEKWNGDTLGYVKEELKDMGWDNDSEIITDQNYIESVKADFGEAEPIEGTVVVSSLNGAGKKLVWASKICPQWLVKHYGKEITE